MAKQWVMVLVTLTNTGGEKLFASNEETVKFVVLKFGMGFSSCKASLYKL